jgi:hypothetical protein
MATARKKAKKTTHFERLRDAGLLEEKHFTGREKKIVNRMSRQEVNTLIRMRRKRGAVRKGREKIRPNIFL